MGIDLLAFRQLGDVGPHLLRIDDARLAVLIPAFSTYTQRTGRRIDQYGQTPFPTGTLGPLLEVLRETLIRPASKAQATAVREVLDVLTSAELDGQGVLFDGD